MSTKILQINFKNIGLVILAVYLVCLSTGAFAQTRVQVQITTGGDDQRGGNRSYISLMLTNGEALPEQLLSSGLGGGTTRTISVTFPQTVAAAQIRSIRIRYDGNPRSGEPFDHYDNWDLKTLLVNLADPLVEQHGWRWCSRCQGLAFADGASSSGSCPVGGSHEHSTSGHYSLFYNAPGAVGQNNWRWCRKCQGLAFGGEALGSCPAGGTHDHTGSGNYTLIHNVDNAPGQSHWRHCHKCRGLAFGDGRCPAGGTHDFTRSGDYTLAHDPHVRPTQQLYNSALDSRVGSLLVRFTGELRQIDLPIRAIGTEPDLIIVALRPVPGRRLDVVVKNVGWGPGRVTNVECSAFGRSITSAASLMLTPGTTGTVRLNFVPSRDASCTVSGVDSEGRPETVTTNNRFSGIF